MDRDCRREILAQGPHCKIESCDCGALHVSVGPLTFRTTEDVLVACFAALTVAVRRLAARTADRAMDQAVAAFITGAGAKTKAAA